MARLFESGEEFLAAARPNLPSCLVLDVNLPGLNGLDLQQEIAQLSPHVPIIFLTGRGDIPMTVRALKAGASNFLTKPVDDEALLNAIQHCISSWLGDGMRSDEHIGNMIGESQALRNIVKDMQIVAPTDATVLIQGETGTGKELVARGIHELSGRSKRPFVMVNCAAIPDTLLESELFGHEKGAFTGAFAQKIGRFESAHGGTLFLDEIGEIPLDLQPKLLRALQQQEFERLGGSRTIQVDVRIVAATNRDLRKMVAENKFRDDLYYRLHVFPLKAPPLRERREDIPLLIRFFTQRYARKLNRPIEEIPSYALEALTNYDWPGNIRELQHLVERSVILSPGRVLQIAVPDAVSEIGVVMRNERPPERERILDALRLSGGVIGGGDGAAARMGLRRTTLQSRMKKLGIARHFQ
jgi:DNA-binding NtrC family response regulator